jgi:hypothetical protein
MTPQEKELFEKIVRTKVILEQTKDQLKHSNYCPTETDPEGFAPCNCGCSNTRQQISKALKELNK